MRNKIFFVFLLLSVISLEIFGQNYSLQIITTDSVSSTKIKYKEVFRDSAMIQAELNSVVEQLINKGFLAASVDSVSKDSLQVVAYLHTGRQFFWSDIEWKGIDPLLKKKWKLKKTFQPNQAFNFQEFLLKKEKILTYYENSGYPFAQIKLENSAFERGKFNTTVLLKKNSFIQIDSLIVKGNADISSFYLQKYLDIAPGDVYDESKLQQISKKIQELSFLNEIQPTQWEFRNDGADVYLSLEPQKANQFNGIVGVMPDTKNKEKLLITGELRISLLNSLHRGESLHFQWKRLETASQKLNAGITYPYLFRTSFGINAGIQIQKVDTSYINTHSQAGLNYFFGGRNHVSLFVQQQRSREISKQTENNFAEVNTLLYGLGYQLENLDYRLNPRKGHVLFFKTGAGNKKLEKDKQVHIQANSRAGIFIPFAKQFTFFINNITGYQYSNKLYENELFRLGGIHSIRGFDEESILTSFYSFFNVEMRFLFEQNSAFFVFFDGGYYEKNTQNNFVADFPLGLGAGMNFNTRSGIFTLSYAIGKQFDNPFQLRAAKIHLGYISRF